MHKCTDGGLCIERFDMNSQRPYRNSKRTKRQLMHEGVPTNLARIKLTFLV